jgi:hypothetical protein
VTDADCVNGLDLYRSGVLHGPLRESTRTRIALTVTDAGNPRYDGNAAVEFARKAKPAGYFGAVVLCEANLPDDAVVVVRFPVATDVVEPRTSALNTVVIAGAVSVPIDVPNGAFVVDSVGHCPKHVEWREIASGSVATGCSLRFE